MITVEALQDEVAAVLCRLRRIDYIVHTSKFTIAVHRANNKQREVCKKLIMKGKEDTLRTWVNEMSRDDVAEMSANSLRRLAKQLRVPYYSRLPRAELVVAVEHARRHPNG